MPDNKARQPNRAAPPVPLSNDKSIIYQRSDNTRSKQHVNEIQRHLIFDACKVTQLALHAVCNHQNYQGTLNALIFLAGGIDVTGTTYISSETLAERIGVNRDTTDAELKRLLKSGIVTITGNHSRSKYRSIKLPCNHFDIDAESHADIDSGSRADTNAESHAESHADTSPHYQITSRSHQDQQQVDVVVSHSLSDRQAILSTINDGLPKGKQIKLTKALNDLFDSWHDNSMSSDEIIAQLHKEQPSWDTAGGTVKALEYITDTWAATYRERQPMPVLVACAGLGTDVECDTMTHTKLGSNDPVQQCPQRKVAS